MVQTNRGRRADRSPLKRMAKKDKVVKEKGLEEWQKLLLERYDTSYRKPHRCRVRVVEKVVEKGTAQLTEDAKKLFYHAGRFAGGARDRVACDSYRELQRAGEI